MASPRADEARFAIGLSLFWFALSYELSPKTFSGLAALPETGFLAGLGAFAESVCIIAVAIAYLVSANQTGDAGAAQVGEAPRPETGRRFRRTSAKVAFASAGACVAFALLPLAVPSEIAFGAADVLCSVAFGLFLCATSFQWVRNALSLGKRRACIVSTFSFLANLLVALGLTVLLGSLGAEDLFGPIVAALPFVSCALAFAPARREQPQERADRTAPAEGHLDWQALARSPYTQMAVALLFYLFASYLFSGMFSHRHTPFSTTLLSKVAAVALVSILVALVVRKKDGRVEFLQVLVFFMLVCVVVSYLVVMLINDLPGFCEQIVLPTRILALFLLWETALLYSESKGVSLVAAVAALFLVPVGIEISFPVFAGFATPLLSDLPAYVWLDACIIPAILLLIMAVFKMQGEANAQAAPVRIAQTAQTAQTERIAEDVAPASGLADILTSGDTTAPTSPQSFEEKVPPAVEAAAAGGPEQAESYASGSPLSRPAEASCIETGAPLSAPAGMDERCRTLAEHHGLTPRESEVLRLLAAGNSQRKIADVLVVSLSSAQTYSKNVYRKLGVHSRQEVIDLVNQNG